MTPLILALTAGPAAAADPPPLVPAKPPAAVLKPDPKAGPAAADLAGYWAAEQTAPDRDTRRAHAWRFVDGQHLVWSLVAAGPGVRSGVTTRFRYTLADGVLSLTPVERYAGEEKLAPRPDDAKPRTYTFAWAGHDKGGFRAADKDNPGSPWAALDFRRADSPADPVDPLVPEAVARIDRAVKKEPKYAGTPGYLLLAFGPQAKFKVWLVLDGTTLYVDRNGNGDLTDPGDKLVLGPVADMPPNPRNPVYLLGDLSDPAGATHTEGTLGVIRTAGGGAYCRLAVRPNGGVLRLAGPTDLRLAESAADARVVHFGPAATVRPAPGLSHLDAGGVRDFVVRVGTPGVGMGSFAAFHAEAVGDGVTPVAEFTFTPTEAGAAPKTVKVPLTAQGGPDFSGRVMVPAGVKAGLDAATVTLSFPDSPWGKVEPVTVPLDVLPKGK